MAISIKLAGLISPGLMMPTCGTYSAPAVARQQRAFLGKCDAFSISGAGRLGGNRGRYRSWIFMNWRVACFSKHGVINSGKKCVHFLCLCRTALHCKNTLRPLLNKDGDEHQYSNFGQNSSRPALKKFIQNTQSHGGINCACQLPHAAQYHDHKSVNNVTLAQVWPYIFHLT